MASSDDRVQVRIHVQTPGYKTVLREELKDYEAPQQGVYRYVVGKNAHWLVRVDVPNIGDHLYSFDPMSSKSQGFGGSWLYFVMQERMALAAVKGPWHSNAGGLLRDAGVDVRDLHLTRVTLYEMVMEPYTGPGYERQPDGRLEWKRELTRDIPVHGPVIYEEKEPALGIFMRGDRIAHAYANATNKSVFCDSESAGGGSKKLIHPGQEMHVMAANNE
jgi:hypothetical protein